MHPVLYGFGSIHLVLYRIDQNNDHLPGEHYINMKNPLAQLQ